MDDMPSATPDRRLVLGTALAGGALAAGVGALAVKRYGLLGKLFNPLSAEKFDLPPVPGLVDAIGAPVPGFSAADIKGETVYLNAFAGWCPNCRDEHKALLDFARSGVRIYGVATLEDPANTLEYLRKAGNPFVKVGVDRKGRLFRALGARGIPASFVLAPAPHLALTLQGAQDLAQMQAKILPALTRV